MVKAAVNQPKERIGGQMLTYLWCNDGHRKPRHENITSFKSGGIFASRFTKCQCSSHGEHSPWRLSGNCCSYSNVCGVVPVLFLIPCAAAFLLQGVEHETCKIPDERCYALTHIELVA